MTHERESEARGGRENSSSASVPVPPPPPQAVASVSGATMTVTREEEGQSSTNEEVLHLTLRPRQSVRWDENVVDNEGLGRKSSKRCCIFHKQRAFGESSTDSSDCESGGDNEGGDESGSSKKTRKIARPKKGEKVPDYQRYHA